MKKQVHQIEYDKESDRWHAFKKGNYYCPIHCGDCMSIRVANRYIPARVELDTHWYVFIDDLKFRLHPKQQYDVILMF